MNTTAKIFFWSGTILLGFVNPLFSIGLVVLYYLPGIIQDICQSCNNVEENYQKDSGMKSFSEDILEDMK